MLNHFHNIKLNQDQLKTINQLKYFLESDKNIFILQGYAGTGKTTLIKGLVNFLDAQKKQFNVMAPTGRAAKVLRNKTDFGSTIHSSIYKLDDLKSINSEAIEVAEHSIKYLFPINYELQDERVLIVDEASMISSKEAKNELFDFGTNFLLDDLLTHTFQTNKKNKIIFVGDPAQLPPVGDNLSKALNINYFKELGYDCQISELTEVMRQDNNLILENATTIRHLLSLKHRNNIQLAFDQKSFIKQDTECIIEKYTKLFPNPAIGDGVIISFSNQQCFHYNLAIRKVLFPSEKDITVGDIIMINNNNQHSYNAALFNGDLAKVVEVSNDLVQQSAPVFILKAGKKVKEIIKLNFRKIVFRIPNFNEEISCYIIDDLLNSIDRDLTPNMSKMLYINFIMRFNQEQDRRSAKDLQKFKIGSKEFKEQLKADPFFNALKIKYGYAITCHKAQGGEWDKVFVDYSGRTGLSDDALKWSYTATTRGINTVYAVNPPHLTTFSGLKISKISNIGKIPNNALYLENVNVSPFHNETHHKAKSLKFWEIKQLLESTKYTITSVQSKEYLEKYKVSNDAGEDFFLEASHKASGHFVNQFKIINNKNAVDEKELEEIFNKHYSTNFNLSYKPSAEFLESLYFVMRACCQDLEISITNIVEQVDKYFVLYHLKTNSISANIQFYFKKKGSLSRVIPSTFNCNDDKKLHLLIEKIEKYAS